MASPITTSSTTLVGQLLECLHVIDEYQADAATNPDGVTLITGFQLNNLNGTITFSGAIPVGEDFASGALQIMAVDNLVDPA